jgi:hypothetical protein
LDAKLQKNGEKSYAFNAKKLQKNYNFLQQKKPQTELLATFYAFRSCLMLTTG